MINPVQEFELNDRRSSTRESDVQEAVTGVANAFRKMFEAHEQREAERDMATERRLEELEGKVEEVSQTIHQLNLSLSSFMEKTPDKIVERIEILIDEAFPDDPEIPDATPSEKRKLHRRYHAKLIKRLMDEEKLNQSIKEKIVTWVIEHALSIATLALLAYFGLKVSA